MAKQLQYQYDEQNLKQSEPNKYRPEDLKAEEMIVNIGPQHPSTHGVLRLEVVTDGEIIVEVVPHLGYLHRCFEKHAENLPYNQTIPFVDRMDYLAAMNSEHAFALGVEQMLGISDKIPPRVEYIRVLISELNRLASHFVAIGTYAMDIGAYTPFLWLMRDREHIMRLLEWTCGARMLYNYIWVGGLFYDLPLGFEERCAEFVNYLRPKLLELERLVIENKIFVERTANVGVLPLDVAINYGVSGPTLRGSGLKFDLRRVDGYSVYPELEFDIPVGEGSMGSLGDCWDRFWVRCEEMKQSARIVRQALDLLPDGPIYAKPKKIRPTGEAWARVESSRGDMFCYVVGAGKPTPERVHFRTGSYNAMQVVRPQSRGVMVADLVALIASLDVIAPEIDR